MHAYTDRFTFISVCMHVRIMNICWVGPRAVLRNRPYRLPRVTRIVICNPGCGQDTAVNPTSTRLLKNTSSKNAALLQKIIPIKEKSGLDTPAERTHPRSTGRREAILLPC